MVGPKGNEKTGVKKTKENPKRDETEINVPGAKELAYPLFALLARISGPPSCLPILELLQVVLKRRGCTFACMRAYADTIDEERGKTGVRVGTSRRNRGGMGGGTRETSDARRRRLQ